LSHNVFIALFRRPVEKASWIDEEVCQRTGERLSAAAGYRMPRTSGRRSGTGGSRRGVHRIRGSVRSTGLSTPWCSVRRAAVSSRK